MAGCVSLAARGGLTSLCESWAGARAGPRGSPPCHDLRTAFVPALGAEGRDAVWHMAFALDVAALGLQGVTQISVSPVWSALRFRYRTEIKRFTRRFRADAPPHRL